MDAQTYNRFSLSEQRSQRADHDAAVALALARAQEASTATTEDGYDSATADGYMPQPLPEEPHVIRPDIPFHVQPFYDSDQKRIRYRVYVPDESVSISGTNQAIEGRAGEWFVLEDGYQSSYYYCVLSGDPISESDPETIGTWYAQILAAGKTDEKTGKTLVAKYPLFHVDFDSLKNLRQFQSGPIYYGGGGGVSLSAGTGDSAGRCAKPYTSGHVHLEPVKGTSGSDTGCGITITSGDSDECTASKGAILFDLVDRGDENFAVHKFTYTDPNYTGEQTAYVFANKDIHVSSSGGSGTTVEAGEDSGIVTTASGSTTTLDLKDRGSGESFAVKSLTYTKSGESTTTTVKILATDDVSIPAGGASGNYWETGGDSSTCNGSTAKLTTSLTIGYAVLRWVEGS